MVAHLVGHAAHAARGRRHSVSRGHRRASVPDRADDLPAPPCGRCSCASAPCCSAISAATNWGRTTTATTRRRWSRTFARGSTFRCTPASRSGTVPKSSRCRSAAAARSRCATAMARLVLSDYGPTLDLLVARRCARSGRVRRLQRMGRTANRYSTSPSAAPRGSNVRSTKCAAPSRLDRQDGRAARAVGVADDERRRKQAFAIERNPGGRKLGIGRDGRVGEHREERRDVGLGRFTPCGERGLGPRHFRPRRIERGVRQAVDPRASTSSSSAARFEPHAACAAGAGDEIEAVVCLRCRLRSARGLPSAATHRPATAGTSAPRDGASGSCREGSRTFVTNAHRAARVTPNQVPPALRSRPASHPSSHHAAGRPGARDIRRGWRRRPACNAGAHRARTAQDTSLLSVASALRDGRRDRVGQRQRRERRDRRASRGARRPVRRRRVAARQ